MICNFCVCAFSTFLYIKTPTTHFNAQKQKFSNSLTEIYPFEIRLRFSLLCAKKHPNHRCVILSVEQKLQSILQKNFLLDFFQLFNGSKNQDVRKNFLIRHQFSVSTKNSKTFDASFNFDRKVYSLFWLIKTDLKIIIFFLSVFNNAFFQKFFCYKRTSKK